MDKKQQPEPTPILDNLLLKTKQAKKQEKYQDKVVGYMTTIGKLSDRCDELNNQVIELQTLISVLRHERTDLKAECYDMLRKAWVEK
jgi:uncharacterized coiled-coil DUF342 family protein